MLLPFEMFLTGSILGFRSTMVSKNNDKGKPMEDDLQDPKLEEEVKSEDEEEVEENLRSCPHATVASIRTHSPTSS
jgi:ferredoxin